MNICFNLKREEPKKITNTKELAEYILESGDDIFDVEGEEDSDNDGFNLKNWSPLMEVYDALPKFVANA